MAKQLCLRCLTPTDGQLKKITGKTHDEDDDSSAVHEYNNKQGEWIDENLGGIIFGEIILGGYGCVLAITNPTIEVRLLLANMLTNNSEANPFNISFQEMDLETVARVL